MGKYCFLHKKIIKDKTLNLLTKIQSEISFEKWKEFIAKLKGNLSKQAPNQISLKKFFKILSLFNVNLSKAEKEDIVECFHLKDEGNQTDINIQAIINIEATKEVNKVYKKIDLDKREDQKELDIIKENLSMISEQELIKVLSRMPNMVDLWKNVKKNDVDTNGFLTIDELNTIFAQIYPELEGRSLFQILRPFCSIQNRSLINYKKLKEYLDTKMAAYLFEKENAEANFQTRNLNAKESLTYDKDYKLLSPRDLKSPSLRRMEQIKDEILKAAVSSPLILANRKLAEKYDAAKSPDIDLQQKTNLEALISPRANQHYLPKLSTTQQINRKEKIPAERIFSPERSSVCSKYSTFSSPFFSKTNEVIKSKLEYEWKNIYRALNSIDINSCGMVSKKEFIDCVQKNGVFLSRDELEKLIKRFSINGEVNYIKISNDLGLHKASYDYIKPSHHYIKNATVLKSIHGGLSHSKSQFGGYIKMPITSRDNSKEIQRTTVKY